MLLPLPDSTSDDGATLVMVSLNDTVAEPTALLAVNVYSTVDGCALA